MYYFFQHNAGFINDGNSQKSETIQLAVNHTNAVSNVSIALKIFDVSTEISLFDQGKVPRLVLTLITLQFDIIVIIVISY